MVFQKGTWVVEVVDIAATSTLVLQNYIGSTYIVPSSYIPGFIYYSVPRFAGCCSGLQCSAVFKN